MWLSKNPGHCCIFTASPVLNENVQSQEYFFDPVNSLYTFVWDAFDRKTVQSISLTMNAKSLGLSHLPGQEEYLVPMRLILETYSNKSGRLICAHSCLVSLYDGLNFAKCAIKWAHL